VKEVPGAVLPLLQVGEREEEGAGPHNPLGVLELRGPPVGYPYRPFGHNYPRNGRLADCMEEELAT
jgi:hypothetical protein